MVSSAHGQKTWQQNFEITWVALKYVPIHYTGFQDQKKSPLNTVRR